MCQSALRLGGGERSGPHSPHSQLRTLFRTVLGWRGPEPWRGALPRHPTTDMSPGKPVSGSVTDNLPVMAQQGQSPAQALVPGASPGGFLPHRPCTVITKATGQAMLKKDSGERARGAAGARKEGMQRGIKGHCAGLWPPDLAPEPAMTAFSGGGSLGPC